MRWVIMALLFVTMTVLMWELVRFEPTPQKYSVHDDLDRSKTVLSERNSSNRIENQASINLKTNEAEIEQQKMVPIQAQKIQSSDSRPRATIETIQRELQALPADSENAATRTMLLHAAASLSMETDETIDQVHDLAINEFFESNSSPSSDRSSLQSFTGFLPVIAHEIVLRTAYDQDEALELTVEGIDYHQDPAVRLSLIKQFRHYFPQGNSLLMDHLRDRNILIEN